MQITWTNCADEMPPDDDGDSVIFNPIGTGLLFRVEVVDGSFVKLMGNHKMRWTPYSDEKWEWLKK